MLRMSLQHAVIVLIFSIFVLPSAKPQNTSTGCQRRCGSDRNSTSVPYPFGFSAGCGIRLNCSHDGSIRIGGFRVANFTADYMLVDLPVNCNRSIEGVRRLAGDNFALTWRNNFLLQNCSSPPNECMISGGMVERRFGLRNCETSSNGNISCYSGYNGSDFFEYDHLERSSCNRLFTSIAVNLNNDTTTNRAVSLEFQALELGWWLGGGCRNRSHCHGDAECISVSPPRGGPGYRCLCREGFEGDGFGAGVGCRRVTGCNASRYISGRCGGATRLAALIGGIIVGAVLMTVIAAVWYFLRRRSTSLRHRTSARRLLSEAAGSSNVPMFPYKELERATNGFAEKQRLGTGAYGTVYAGKLHSDDWVAIKKIRHRDNDGIEQVMNEIKLLSSVSHPNLVRLLGCCIENGEQILVYEFMPHGTLSQHLQRERGNGLPWTIRLTIADETAHAIAHLHSATNPPIYHRDIKSSNILLDYNFSSKVADFGLSRFGMTDDSHISTAPQGTPGYVDPQYHQNFHLSDKSDVYSFGVVLLEIITGLRVVDFTRPHTEVNLAALAIDRIGRGKLDDIIDPFLEPHRDAWTLSSVHKVAELAFRCLAFHCDMRPSMMEVADELEQIRISGWGPLEETMCTTSSVASSCSSPYNGSERSFGSTTARRGGVVGSRKLVVPLWPAADSLETLQDVKDSSPVSVQDHWASEQSSPSTNSLLDNIVR